MDIATAIDRDVRVAMAKVDPRTVYFPEPNTFIKLLDGVTFDRGDQEGEILARSLGKIRGEEWCKQIFTFYEVAPDAALDLSDLVFAVPDDTRPAELAGMDRATFEQYVTKGRAEELLKSIKGKNLGAPLRARPSLGKIINGTHQALRHGGRIYGSA